MGLEFVIENFSLKNSSEYLKKWRHNFVFKKISKNSKEFHFNCYFHSTISAYPRSPCFVSKADPLRMSCFENRIVKKERENKF